MMSTLRKLPLLIALVGVAVYGQNEELLFSSAFNRIDSWLLSDWYGLQPNQVSPSGKCDRVGHGICLRLAPSESVSKHLVIANYHSLRIEINALSESPPSQLSCYLSYRSDSGEWTNQSIGSMDASKVTTVIDLDHDVDNGQTLEVKLGNGLPLTGIHASAAHRSPIHGSATHDNGSQQDCYFGTFELFGRKSGPASTTSEMDSDSGGSGAPTGDLVSPRTEDDIGRELGKASASTRGVPSTIVISVAAVALSLVAVAVLLWLCCRARRRKTAQQKLSDQQTMDIVISTEPEMDQVVGRSESDKSEPHQYEIRGFHLDEQISAHSVRERGMGELPFSHSQTQYNALDEAEEPSAPTAVGQDLGIAADDCPQLPAARHYLHKGRALEAMETTTEETK